MYNVGPIWWKLFSLTLYLSTCRLALYFEQKAGRAVDRARCNASPYGVQPSGVRSCACLASGSINTLSLTRRREAHLNSSIRRGTTSSYFGPPREVQQPRCKFIDHVLRIVRSTLLEPTYWHIPRNRDAAENGNPLSADLSQRQPTISGFLLPSFSR